MDRSAYTISSNLVLFVVAVLIVAGGYWLTQPRHVSMPSAQTPAPSSVAPRPVLMSIEHQLGISAPITAAPSGADSWLLSDGSAEPLAGSSFEIDSDPQLGSLPTASITEPQLAIVASQLDRAFSQAGLTPNPANTRDHPSDLVTLQRGYEAGSLRCLATLVVQTTPFGQVFCGSRDAQQAAWQAAIFPSLFPGANTAASETRASVENVVDGFARGQAGSTSGGGYYWIAQQQGPVWKMLYSGQDYPLCRQVDQSQIPRSIYQNCYDAQTQTLRFNS